MRVLVTRPQPGAARTAARLQVKGHDPVLLPLSRIVAIPGRASDPVERSAGAFAVTSAAALKHWNPSGQDRHRLPLYTVGGRTASQALAAGFTDVRKGPGTGRDLARMIVADESAGRLELSDVHPLVYIAGRVRKSTFESELAACKVPFSSIEVYNTEKISYSADFLNDRLKDMPVDGVLLYSANAASMFFELAHPILSSNELKNIEFFCISETVAAIVRETAAARCHVAKDPDEHLLLSLL